MAKNTYLKKEKAPRKPSKPRLKEFTKFNRYEIIDLNTGKIYGTIAKFADAIGVDKDTVRYYIDFGIPKQTIENKYFKILLNITFANKT